MLDTSRHGCQGRFRLPKRHRWIRPHQEHLPAQRLPRKRQDTSKSTLVSRRCAVVLAFAGEGEPAAPLVESAIDLRFQDPSSCAARLIQKLRPLHMRIQKGWSITVSVVPLSTRSPEGGTSMTPSRFGMAALVLEACGLRLQATRSTI